MAETDTTNRMLIHTMFNNIKRVEIENAKTMKYDDKEMVGIIAQYILKCAEKQEVQDEI